MHMYRTKGSPCSQACLLEHLWAVHSQSARSPRECCVHRVADARCCPLCRADGYTKRLICEGLKVRPPTCSRTGVREHGPESFALQPALRQEGCVSGVESLIWDSITSTPPGEYLDGHRATLALAWPCNALLTVCLVGLLYYSYLTERFFANGFILDSSEESTPRERKWSMITSTSSSIDSLYAPCRYTAMELRL